MLVLKQTELLGSHRGFIPSGLIPAPDPRPLNSPRLGHPPQSFYFRNLEIYYTSKKLTFARAARTPWEASSCCLQASRLRNSSPGAAGKFHGWCFLLPAPAGNHSPTWAAPHPQSLHQQLWGEALST